MGLRQIVGPSGAGLTRELTRLYQRTPAAVMLTSDPRAHLTYLRETVAEELAFGLEQRGTPIAEMEARIHLMAEILDLTDFLEKSPHELSGGQTRRVAMGTVLILNSPMILLDDPFSGLDQQSRTLLIDHLGQLDAEVVVAGHHAWVQGAPTQYLGAEPVKRQLPDPVAPTGEILRFDGLAGRRGGATRRWWQFHKPIHSVFEVGPVDLALIRGGVAWLRGPNGAGKTTLMRALAGLDGTPAPDLSIGLMLQDPGDQVIDSDVATMVPDTTWLNIFHLDPEAHPLDLSQRELRLAQYAGELAKTPELLLADEPDVGLDPEGRSLFHQGLATYLDQGGTVLLSCHDESFPTEISAYATVNDYHL